MPKRKRPPTKRRSSTRPNRRSGRTPSFDLRSMSGAIQTFLETAGIDLSQPQLVDTPDRVARSWREEFLDGYDADPAAILRDSFEADGTRLSRASGLVLVKDIPFHGLCPHHLLPLQGLAHIGYLPDGKLVPFSGLVRLLDCFAHRLEVQETVTKQVAEALMTHLGVKGAASVLEAEQTCLTLRGVKRLGTRIVTSHFAGVFASSADLRSEFLRSVGSLE
ncbi:MAG: GTP cyclohydrolase I [Nitrospiraceae bacterium]